MGGRGINRLDNIRGVGSRDECQGTETVRDTAGGGDERIKGQPVICLPCYIVKDSEEGKEISACGAVVQRAESWDSESSTGRKWGKGNKAVNLETMDERSLVGKLNSSHSI